MANSWTGYFTFLGAVLVTALLHAESPPEQSIVPAWMTSANEPYSVRLSDSPRDSTRNFIRFMNFSTDPASVQNGSANGIPSAQPADDRMRDIVTKPQTSAASDLLKPNDSSANDDGPDVGKPGPDMGDYPNSAYTLKKNRLQFEIAPASFRTRNANNASAYATPFLLRYGLTDDVEFRVLGTGLTSLISPNEITGFGVLTFDTKIHLWNDQIKYLIPAVSFEASLQTQIGSPAFQAGTEPALNINMDFPFTEKTNFEATIGYSGNQTSVNLISFFPKDTTLQGKFPSGVQFNENVYVAYLQWAVEQELTEKFSVFVHGFVARPVSTFNETAVVTGAGFFYQCSKQTMLFGSANAGLTDVPAPFLTQLGVAYAF